MNLVFPFLKLPREIRNFVYQQLLSTQYTFTHPYTNGSYGWPFKFTPAILRINKQVSSEASQVLYRENQFIVLRIATVEYTCFTDFPNFTGLSENQIPHPVLEITIRDLEMVPLDHRTIKTFIFTLEGFPYFIEQLWLKCRKCNFYRIMSLALSVYCKAPSRRSFLNYHIVRSLDQVPGFAEFQINGDVDDEIVRHLTECMTRGPHLQDVMSTMTGFIAQGEGYYKRKDYGPAKWHWARQSIFRNFCNLSHQVISHLTPHRTRYSFKDYLEATVPVILKLGLRRHMLALHMKRYQLAADHALDIPNLVQDLISDRSLSYRVPPVLEAKFSFCKSIGLFVLGRKARLTVAHTIAVRSICQDRRFATKSFSEVSEQLWWARDRYLEQQEGPWKCQEKRTSTSMLNTQVTAFGWRSFEDWMELPDEDTGS